jgi:hypothetical protein
MKALLLIPVLFLPFPVQADKSPEACVEIIRSYFQLKETGAFDKANEQVDLLSKALRFTFR